MQHANDVTASSTNAVIMAGFSLWAVGTGSIVPIGLGLLATLARGSESFWIEIAKWALSYGDSPDMWTVPQEGPKRFVAQLLSPACVNALTPETVSELAPPALPPPRPQPVLPPAPAPTRFAPPAVPATPKEHPVLRKLDPFPHVAVIGPTGSGKSTMLVNLAYYHLRKGDLVIVLDPHGQVDDYPTGTITIGAGARQADCALALALTYELMQARYKLRAQRKRGEPPIEFRRIIVIADEWRSIASSQSDAGGYLGKLLIESRKVRIRLILGSQSKTVDSLFGGAKGAGDGGVRESVTLCYLSRGKNGEYIARIDGEPMMPAPPELIHVDKNATLLDSDDVEDFFRGLFPTSTPSKTEVEPEEAEEVGLEGVEARPSPLPAPSAPSKKEVVANLIREGATATEIIKQVWGVTGGSGYQAASREYQEIVRSLINGD